MRDLALEIEMFGVDAITAEAERLRDLPLDADTYSVERAGHSADAKVTELLGVEFASAICGMEPEEFSKIVSQPAPPALRPLAEVIRESAEESVAEIDFNDLRKRANRAVKRVPEHRRACTKMVNAFRDELSAFSPLASDETLDWNFASIAETMAAFVTQRVAEA